MLLLLKYSCFFTLYIVLFFFPAAATGPSIGDSWQPHPKCCLNIGGPRNFSTHTKVSFESKPKTPHPFLPRHMQVIVSCTFPTHTHVSTHLNIYWPAPHTYLDTRLNLVMIGAANFILTFVSTIFGRGERNSNTCSFKLFN